MCNRRMKKSFITILFVLFNTVNAEEVTYKNMTLKLPDNWSLDHSVIYSPQKAKIGELISKDSWPYKYGKDFVAAFKLGFADDASSTKFLSAGISDNVYWVCRREVWEGASGDFGIWYARRFWVSGPIVTMYSYKSCEENFDEALLIAKTLKES